MGTPRPRKVTIRQDGRIRSSADSKWLRFKARETYDVAQPGFEWKAALKIGPATVGRAHDSLNDGAGRMHVKLLGLIDVVNADGPEMDQGSLMRWLNETMWFPAVWATDLITWRDGTASSAFGSVSAGELTVEAEFCFDRGRLVDFRADRFRDIGDGFEIRPWSTPISEHWNKLGIEMPRGGAGVWHLPDGDFEYIQLRLTDIDYAV